MLPSVTLCLDRLDYFLAVNATLKTSLVNCTIGDLECDHNDFYSFETPTIWSDEIVICYVLNGGRNSSGHLNKIKSTRKTAHYSGFKLQFFLPKDHYFIYFINDAYVKPVVSEINKYFLSGTTNDFILEKIVETKLEYPFNNCWERINLPDSPLVRQLSAANITYRQVNCFELCLRNFAAKYALEHRISEDEARRKEEVKNYDRDKNCNDLCPLECENTQYKITESKFYLADYSEYTSPWIPVVEQKFNITVNSTEEFNKNSVEVTVFFDSLKYTKISQTPKTSLSALVSNFGGSFGLFLDLSFLSACRAIEFILGMIFKL